MATTHPTTAGPTAHLNHPDIQRAFRKAKILVAAYGALSAAVLVTVAVLARFALHGHLVDMYDGGQRGRDLSIDRGAARPAADLREELRLAQQALEEAWGRLAPEDWRRPVRFRNATVLDTALARCRETEIHAVDLAVGYRPRDWSLSFALHALDFLAARAPAGVQLVLRATDHPFARSLGTGSPVEVSGAVRDLAAWMAGRSVDGPLHTSACALPEPGPWPPDPAD
ncbi:maleylpyruvate isomerase family mycothiol-dependent enzyme [Streptomyces decoyicus]|uniref:maleylpyruvate isomerase family mycothiol-dependent enzyme n=1 Tax=Streptomyces decoyicus TaxID=249567 RepID=UPI0033F85351